MTNKMPIDILTEKAGIPYKLNFEFNLLTKKILQSSSKQNDNDKLQSFYECYTKFGSN